MAETIKRKLTEPTIPKPFIEFYSRDGENVTGKGIYLNIKQFVISLVAISSIFNDYPDTLTTLLGLLL